MKAHLALIASLVFSLHLISDATQPTVTLKDGTVLQGVSEEFHSDLLPAHGKIESFYGIPYAEAPVGPLRFKPPVPKKQLESPFNATHVGSSCWQPDPETVGLRLINEVLSEDCLFLDVMVPKPTPEKAAVLVSIHGGGFLVGAGQMPFFSFLTSVVYGEVIIVAMNYRLGALGFLTSGDDFIPGNFGLLDQQLALKWVNENIEAFGGDPNRVTIAGVSAGSASVGFHMLSPGSQGLFQNAIMESGSPIDPWVVNRQGEEARLEVKTLAKLLECNVGDGDDDVKLAECFWGATAENITAKSGMVPAELGNPYFMPPGPRVDGVFLPKDPLRMIEEGVLNGENVIVGTNGDEGTLLLLSFFPDKEVKPVVNSTIFSTALDGSLGNSADPVLLEIIKTIYTVDPTDLVDEKRDDFFHELVQYIGDYVMMCTGSKFARLTSQWKNVYRYTMTFVPSNNFFEVKWAGAAHGDEVQYVAGGPFHEQYVDKTTDEEKEMSRRTMSYWMNFIKTGDPNGADKSVLPDWPKYTKDDPIFKDLTPAMDNRYIKRRECYFMEKVIPPLQDALSKKIRISELEGK
ncbi:Acetylcholinesterase [Holothuria leucospilota]|uniref:Carboxylic ester hydrolase n=1 Tax=Holothuria leucospilota TaxID=206669 RepID=A0A9Q1BTE5_HOLLE|nr:Acetylcholinesterase [Holothuria leucospilota]